MSRPNPSCTNDICSPTLREIEVSIGCWGSKCCGYSYASLVEIMAAKESMFQPTVLVPEQERWIQFADVAMRGGETTVDAARRFWLRLQAHGYVD